jgi:hypothetical protein
VEAKLKVLRAGEVLIDAMPFLRDPSCPVDMKVCGLEDRRCGED